jgi:hypothetical protein
MRRTCRRPTSRASVKTNRRLTTIQVRETAIEIRDRAFEHRAVCGGTRDLEIGKRSSARQLQRRAMRLPRSLFTCDGRFRDLTN